jgi:hypothetical protein
MAKRLITRRTTPKKGKSHVSAPEKARQSIEPKPEEALPERAYDKRFAAIARKMCELGALDRDLAEAFGVSDRSIRAWKHQHPEFCAALELGKDIPDNNVKRSLYNRAVGYSFDSEKLFVDRDGCEHRMPYVEHVPPDVVAGIFWMKNRDPENWRDRQQVDHVITTAEMLQAARRRALERTVVSEQQAQAA